MARSGVPFAPSVAYASFAPMMCTDPWATKFPGRYFLSEQQKSENRRERTLNAPTQRDSAQDAQCKHALLERLARILPSHCILSEKEDTRPYECDGLTLYRQLPMVVVLPENDAQVADVLRLCHALQVPVVARGAGTGLSGSALPHASGVLLSLAKLNRILKIDALARTATVQPGVRNLAISEAAAPHRLYYAPDPSSQIACTIGGNVAENSGGVHCLKYGLTLHNVLRVRGLTMEGETVEFGGDVARCAGPRPAGAGDRLRRHARGHHRSDGEAGADAAAGALHHGELRRCGRTPAMRWPH